MAASRTPSFRGRSRERQKIDRLLDSIRAGDSSVLVIRGEAGIGKTALLHYCARQASGCRVVGIAGVESEVELPFAALHQLCRSMLDDISALPEPQASALRVTFGLAVGSAPDRFVVGLALLSLLAEVAADRPLVCLVDDAQWLDDASAQVLGFVGRRLVAESVLLLFGVRELAAERLLPSLPDLTLEGLIEDDARALLTAVVPGHLDDRVRDRIVAETGGNPLGLLELPREMSPAELAGGFAATEVDAASVSVHLQDHYVRRVRALPDPTQRLMLLAAADPTGDVSLLWRAAQTFDVRPDAAAASAADQLLQIGSRVRFHHPLVRSASYAAGTEADRCAAHLALARATDAQTDPERRVWHLAAAATGLDDGVAAELERMADRVQARAGLAASAAFLQRSVALTTDPRQRADRALDATLAHMQAGAFDAALGILSEAEAAAVDDLQRARGERLRGLIEWASNPGPRAPVLLLRAAKRLEALDVPLARETYLEAWLAALVAGRHAVPGGDLFEVSRAARSIAQHAREPRACDLILDGLTTMITNGRTVAAPSLRRAIDVFLRDEVSENDWLQWGILAHSSCALLWDFDNWAQLNARQVELARASGALAPLSIGLNARGQIDTWRGDFEAARAAIAEEAAVKEVAGIPLYSSAALMLAAYQGRPADASPLIEMTATDAIARGEGMGSQLAHWTTAILYNGLCRYADAAAEAEEAADELYGPWLAGWVLPELIEAATRTGNLGLANDALRRLSTTTIEDADWAVGIEARSRALVSDGRDAEKFYAESVERLSRTRLRPELARAHLLYGEWLRREPRPVDARIQLRAAYDLFVTMGAEAFAERARRELVATGEHPRKREVVIHNELTPQEEQIARLARDGRTNPEIGAELFISARTVEWHLRKVFAKLGVNSRKALPDALPATAAVRDPGRTSGAGEVDI